MEPTPSPVLSENDFDKITNFAKEELGLNIRPEKRQLVASRLLKRLKQLNLDSFSDYSARLKKNSREEARAMGHALTTNVTSFFREAHHFQLLGQLAKNEFSHRMAKGEEIRLWSAGCSTGAEAFSMAMTLCDNLPMSQLKQVKILATDIDEKILEKAANAEYGHRELESEEIDRIKRYADETPNGLRIKKRLREMVHFRNLNLVKTWPVSRSFSVIFCRNVAIYFDDDTQANLWKRFLDQLEPSGRLIVGHSERLDSLSLSRVKSIGVTAYEKEK